MIIHGVAFHRLRIWIGLILIVAVLGVIGILVGPTPDPSGLSATAGPGRVRQEQSHSDYTMAILPGMLTATGIEIAGTVRGQRLEVFDTAFLTPPTDDAIWDPPRLTDAAGQIWPWLGSDRTTRPHPYHGNPLHPQQTFWGQLTQYDYHTLTLRFARPAADPTPPTGPLRLSVTVGMAGEFAGYWPIADPFTFVVPLPPATP